MIIFCKYRVYSKQSRSLVTKKGEGGTTKLFHKKYKKQKKKMGTMERGYGPKNAVFSLIELYCKGSLEPRLPP